LSQDEPTRTSIQIEEGLHVEDGIGQYINHSFEPTCKIDGLTVRALKDIVFGEEITFDYTLNESFISSPFVCRDTGTSVGNVTDRGIRMKRLLVIDALNMYFRAYIVDPSLSTNGQPIGGLERIS
jgi:hypothetical protein